MPKGNPNFKGFYMFFDACKKGFLAKCRPMIKLDRCFMKGACKGEILVAISRDANNHIYTFIWDVLFQEDIETWEWFLSLLMEDLGLLIEGSFGYTFVTNQ